MENLFVSVRWDGKKEVTKLGQLFLSLEEAQNKCFYLKYEEGQDPFAFNESIDEATKELRTALHNLKLHCADVDRSAQMAGVM
jgi:hypothetical protein